MEHIEALYSFLLSDLFQSYLLAVTSVVTAAAAVTAITPTKTDNKIVDVILKVLNLLACKRRDDR